MRESNWYGIPVCTECNKRLSDSQKMYSSGICPYCGHNSNGTVCDTNMVTLKKIILHPWWRFWKREFKYIGKNEFSDKWANPEKYKK